MEKSALEAVSEALSEVQQAPVEHEEPAEATESEEPAEQTEEEPAEGDEPAEEEGEEGEEKPAKESAESRNPDGTFKKKEGEKEGKSTPKEGEVKPDPNAAKKQPDPVNDPIPKDLKKETQDRMRSLISTTKEVTAERDQAKSDLEVIVSGLRDAGTTPEQYRETLSFLSLFNSQDVKQQGQALDMLETMADRLSMQIGRERTVSDPLKSHADLLDAVSKGQITREYAKQLATARNANTFRQEVQTQANTQNQQQQQAQQANDTARNELNTLEQALRATDSQYEAKKALIVPILKPIFASLHPTQWKAAFENAYRNAKVAAPARAATTPRGVPANQPLRAGKNPAGSRSKEPTSMLEALSGALADVQG